MARAPKFEKQEIDGATFVIERGLPVFHAFQGVSEHTGEPFAVTDDDLPEIAERTATLIGKRLPIINIIGHRHNETGEAEKTQPSPIGMWLNPRVGKTPTGKPAVVMDCYTHESHWDSAKKHPFRSPEYSLARKEIRAVSRLTRNPRMDELGGTLYFHDGDQLIRFADDEPLDTPGDSEPEDEADDEESTPLEDEKAGDEPGKDDSDTSLLDEQLMATIAEQLLKEFPGLASLRAGADKGEGKKADDAPSKTEDFAAKDRLERFAAIESENKELRGIVNNLVAEKNVAECKAMLVKLERFQFDEATELDRLKNMTPEDRVKHLAYMEANYKSKPGQAAPLQLFQGAVPDYAKGEGKPHPGAVNAHFTKNAHRLKSYDEAEAELMGKQAA